MRRAQDCLFPFWTYANLECPTRQNNVCHGTRPEL